MAHLKIEYSKALEELMSLDALVQTLHKTMVTNAVFPTAGIRVRAFCADYALVADGLSQNNFVAMTLSVGVGRELAVLQAAGDELFAAARTILAEPLTSPYFALSLEIHEITPELSWKDTPIHARLSKGPS